MSAGAAGRRTAGGDGADVALSSPPVPGEKVFVLFGGDPVWHEMVFVWGCGGGDAVVYTPDQDLYVETIVGGRGPGATRHVRAGPRGAPVVRVRGDIYRFREGEAPVGNELLGIIRAGKVEAEAYVEEHGGEVGRYTEYVTEGVRRRLPGDLGDGGGPVAAGGRDSLAAAAEEAGPVEAGKVWICTDVGHGGVLGEEMVPGAGDLLTKDGVGLFRRRGLWLRGELVDVLEAEARVRAVRAAGRAQLGEAPAAAAVEREEPPVEMRTLAVRYDAREERHRDWRDAAAEFVEDEFADWPVSGPRTMVWLCRHWSRQGCTPVQWLDRYLAAEPYGAGDRSAHELRCLSEVFQTAGCYDQLNLGGCACFELLARRWQLILSAHAKSAASPDYSGGEHFEGLERRRVGVAPQLQEYVAKKMKDEAEIEKQKDKARGLRAAAPGKK